MRTDFLDPPEGWTVIGELPPFDPSAADASEDWQADWLTEDLLTASSPGDRIVIDVGWLPQGDPKGHFRGVVVFEDEWDEPIEVFQSQDLEDVSAWFRERLRTYAASDSSTGAQKATWSCTAEGEHLSGDAVVARVRSEVPAFMHSMDGYGPEA